MRNLIRPSIFLLPCLAQPVSRWQGNGITSSSGTGTTTSYETGQAGYSRAQPTTQSIGPSRTSHYSTETLGTQNAHSFGLPAASLTGATQGQVTNLPTTPQLASQQNVQAIHSSPIQVPHMNVQATPLLPTQNQSQLSSNISQSPATYNLDQNSREIALSQALETQTSETQPIITTHAWPTPVPTVAPSSIYGHTSTWTPAPSYYFTTPMPFQVYTQSQMLSNQLIVSPHLEHPTDFFANLLDQTTTSTKKSKSKKKKHQLPTPPPTDYFIVEPPPPIIIHETVEVEGKPNATTIMLLHDIEERLARIEQAHAPKYIGVLPTQYFDPSSSVAEKSAVSPPPHNNPVYAPVQITDQELLARQPLTLSPYRQAPNNLNIYCYPFTPEEITGKCLGGMEMLGATGLYLPMMTEIGTEKSAEYYDAIRTLRKMRRKDGKKYNVFGVAYDNPNWALITQVVLKYDLWDGVMIEWVGTNACIWNIHQPTRGQIDTILENAGPIYYFFRQQSCDLSLRLTSPFGAAFVNPNEEVDVSDINVIEGQFPKFLTPVFPCFQGEEGPCYNAFRYYTEDACSDKQVRAPDLQPHCHIISSEIRLQSI
eukprot:Blabericola_migrator_1__330@NODE_1084_length_5492_cov_106_716682_g643_i1_p1_GENE_NODE_1084_length_5492_cov_106_716682_g643_i1NODE_1084_length_5492_cov_106_716682_g643_i1_p1_ORF_typecomplete_len595_score61_41_NODE_1084_length_5492_cov_106_716682_g643_i129864770